MVRYLDELLFYGKFAHSKKASKSKEAKHKTTTTKGDTALELTNLKKDSAKDKTVEAGGKKEASDTTFDRKVACSKTGKKRSEYSYATEYLMLYMGTWNTFA